MHSLIKGASVSCLSLKFVERLKTKILTLSRGDVTRQSFADGSPLMAFKKFDVTLNIQGLKIAHTFYIELRHSNGNFHCYIVNMSV